MSTFMITLLQLLITFLTHRTHEMKFKLNQSSLFRVYTEPHWVDIDLHLYLVTKTTTQQIASGTAGPWAIIQQTRDYLSTHPILF